MDKQIQDDATSHPQQLRSMEYVDQAIETEVKEIRIQQRQATVRAFTDVSLMLLTILITVLASLWLM
jgi:hypothetical protein